MMTLECEMNTICVYEILLPVVSQTGKGFQEKEPLILIIEILDCELTHAYYLRT